jgi:hypothetical protein
MQVQKLLCFQCAFSDAPNFCKLFFGLVQEYQGVRGEKKPEIAPKPDNRHCERSEAIDAWAAAARVWIASSLRSLAMTAGRWNCKPDPQGRTFSIVAGVLLFGKKMFSFWTLHI